MVHFHPRFKFYFQLSLRMVIYDHDYKTKTIKIEPRINKPQHIPQLFSSLEIICIKHSVEGFCMQEAHSHIVTFETAKHNRRTSGRRHVHYICETMFSHCTPQPEYNTSL